MMYATHNVRVATKCNERINDVKTANVEYLVDTMEPGTLVEHGSIHVSGARDSEWFGQTSHFV